MSCQKTGQKKHINSTETSSAFKGGRGMSLIKNLFHKQCRPVKVPCSQAFRLDLPEDQLNIFGCHSDDIRHLPSRHTMVETI